MRGPRIFFFFRGDISTCPNDRRKVSFSQGLVRSSCFLHGVACIGGPFECCFGTLFPLAALARALLSSAPSLQNLPTPVRAGVTEMD